MKDNPTLGPTAARYSALIDAIGLDDATKVLIVTDKVMRYMQDNLPKSIHNDAIHFFGDLITIHANEN